MTYKLPYLTPGEIAERWKCSLSIVETLLREGRLKSVPLLAAVHNKQDIRCVLTEDFRAEPGVWAAYPDEWVIPVYHPNRPGNTATPEDALEFAYAELMERGDFDLVVLSNELEIFEQKHAPPAGTESDTPSEPAKRGPKTGARDINLYRVITGLSLAMGYREGQKQAQGWREKIVIELQKRGISIDPDRVTDVIREAFKKSKPQ